VPNRWVQAHAVVVQRLQLFLSAADQAAQAIGVQRLASMVALPAPVSHARGVIVLDDSTDREHGRVTTHGALQYIGSCAKTDSAIVPAPTL
jgi:SRSO17 transposase